MGIDPISLGLLATVAVGTAAANNQQRKAAGRMENMARDEAEAARRVENQRQADIAAGSQRVNSEFDRFGDEYYGGVERSFMDFYRPQLQEQFNAARRRVILNNPSSGTSTFATQLGDLERDFGREQTSLADRARTFVNQQRGRIEGARTQLLEQVRGGLDQQAAANQAVNQASASSMIEPFSPLGELFGRYAEMYGRQRLVNAARGTGRGDEDGLLMGGGRSGGAGNVIYSGGR